MLYRGLSLIHILTVPGQHLHVRHAALRHKQQLFFNLIFGEGIRGIVFFIHKDIFVAIDIGEVNVTAGQRHGVNDIISFETLFYFQPGTDIRKTHFVQRSGTAGSGRLNINVLNQQQFAVVIQYLSLIHISIITPATMQVSRSLRPELGARMNMIPLIS